MGVPYERIGASRTIESMKFATIAGVLLPVAALVAVVGCGGNGSNSFGGSTSGSFGTNGGTAGGSNRTGGTKPSPEGAIAVFLNASGGQYEHFWVRIYDVQFQTGKDSALIYGGHSGKLVDLAAMKNQAWLLGLATSPGSEFVRAQIVLDKSVSYSNSGDKLQPGEFSNALDVDKSRTRLLVNLNPRTTPSSPVAISFDLGAFSQDTNGRFVPSAKGDEPKTRDLDENQLPITAKGMVATLTGSEPDRKFVLQGDLAIPVLVDTKTAWLGDGKDLSKELCEGKSVSVRGVYSQSAKALLADSVRFVPQGSGSVVQIVGTVLSTADQSIQLSPKLEEADLTGQTLPIKLDGQTRFLSSDNELLTAAQFLAKAKSAVVHIDGILEDGSVTADSISIEAGRSIAKRSSTWLKATEAQAKPAPKSKQTPKKS